MLSTIHQDVPLLAGKIIIYPILVDLISYLTFLALKHFMGMS
jgi:hypothetical protein